MMRRLAVPVALVALFGLVGRGAMAQSPLVTVDGAKLKQMVAKYRGKVVVVNFWATWCGPCMAELPSLVKLQKAYASKGVQVILVTLDDQSSKGAAQKVLTKLGATTANAIVATGASEKTVKAIASDWGGSIPLTVVCSKSGKVTDKMIGGREYAEFDRVTKAALSAK